MTGLSNLCDDRCPQQLFGCPFSASPVDNLQDPGSDSCLSAPFELQSQPSPQCSHWTGGSPTSCRKDRCIASSCFYQLDMHGRHFVSQRPDSSTAVDGTGSSHGLQVEFRLSPSASPPSSAVLPSHFQAFGSLLQPSPVQHPSSLTQWRGKPKLSSDLWISPGRVYFRLQDTRRNCIYLILWNRIGAITCVGVMLVLLKLLFKLGRLSAILTLVSVNHNLTRWFCVCQHSCCDHDTNQMNLVGRILFFFTVLQWSWPFSLYCFIYQNGKVSTQTFLPTLPHKSQSHTFHVFYLLITFAAAAIWDFSEEYCRVQNLSLKIIYIE